MTSPPKPKRRRRISDAELAALIATHCDIPPERLARIVEPQFIASPEDPDELRYVRAWPRSWRLKLLLLGAKTYGPRPH